MVAVAILLSQLCCRYRDIYLLPCRVPMNVCMVWAITYQMYNDIILQFQNI